MIADRLAARLVESGLEAGEVARKHDLIQRVTAGFTRLQPGDLAPVWWVPGRLEVFGKHTDYGGGHSLVGTLPRGFVLIARPRGDGVIHMRDAQRGEDLELTPAAVSAFEPEPSTRTESPVTGWRRYAHVAVRRLTRNFPGASLGADIVFGSDLPSASGMSSSSALVVGLVHALVELGGLRERSEWRDNIRGIEDVAGYYACFENGFSFGSLAGDGGVGTHGGSEDHVAIVCGGSHHVSAWQFVPIRHVGEARVPEDWTFVIASSGVAAQKIGAAKERYNSLSRRASSLLELWNRSESPQPSLFAAVSSSASAPDRLRALARSASDGHLDARLEQFLREDKRVLEALDACGRADRARMGDLSEASQTDAESLLGNQVPETIALTRAARDLGAFAASSFGAGFGGSVWALVDRPQAPAFADRWLADYLSRFPFRTAATTFVARPGPGLTRVM